METKLHIIHLGTSGFPYGFGAMQRIILMYRGLVSVGADVFVVNRKGRHLKDSQYDLNVEGEYKGIPYVYTSGVPYKPAGFLERNKSKVIGFWNEWKLLRQRKKSGKLEVAMVYLTGEFHYLLYYRFLTRLLRIPMVLSYVEYRTAFNNRKGFRASLNDKLFDAYAARFADATLPISDYLVDVVKQQSREKPFQKLPVLCDFELFNTEREPKVQPYFLFVGAASYIEVVEFVAHAYDALGDADVPLRLILGGNSKEIKRVSDFLETLDSRKKITVIPNVPHAEIPQQLANAAALLIPLRPGVQDAARFPHKIGEYLASGNPLITTDYGDISIYFEDEKNALIAPSYNPTEFAKKMQFVLDHPEEARIIGERGLETGKSKFDYKTLGHKLNDFLLTLTGNIPVIMEKK